MKVLMRYMKSVLIILTVLILIFTIIQIYAMSCRTSIENYPYTVVKKFKEFEIRNYEASLFTSVKLGTNEYESASNAGFFVLGGYIFGGKE